MSVFENTSLPELRLDKQSVDNFLSWYSKTLLEKPDEVLHFFERKLYGQTLYSLHCKEAVHLAANSDLDLNLEVRSLLDQSATKSSSSNSSASSSSKSPAAKRKTPAKSNKRKADADDADGNEEQQQTDLSDEKNYNYVAFTPSQFEALARMLLLEHKSHRIELWGLQSATSSKEVWERRRTAQPDDLQGFEALILGGEDDEHAGSGDADIILGIKVNSESGGGSGQHKIGAAYANLVSRTILVNEFLDNDSFALLESTIIQLGARKVLAYLDPNDLDSKKLRDVFARCEIVAIELKKTDFSTKDLEQDLRNLIGATPLASRMSELDKRDAMAAAAALIRYLELLSDSGNFGQYRLESFSLRNFMRLDAAAVKALHLLPMGGENTSSNKEVNLYGLLNKCKTAMGSRRLAHWIRQPLVEISEIDRRLNIVEAFVEDAVLRQSLRDESLKGISDLDKLIKKFFRQRAKLQDCFALYKAVQALPSIQQALRGYEGIHQQLIQTSYISPFDEIIQDLRPLEELIETSLDMEEVEHHQFLINPGFDDSLGQIKAERDGIVQQIDVVHQEVLRKTHNESIKLKSTDKQGYYFHCTKKEEAKIRKMEQFSVFEVRSNGAKFTNSKLSRLNASYLELQQKYVSLQEELEHKVIEVVTSFMPVLEDSSNLVADIDILASFAHTAISSGAKEYVRPHMLPMDQGSEIILKASRHPCVEVQDISTVFGGAPSSTALGGSDTASLASLGASRFIPNDVEMRKGESSFTIITGPNMGGKSTYIRQIGVCVLMAQIGSFVPCDEARITICDCIMARVGASDSQLRGVSTFMAEMLETATILHGATEHSLIIIDELGRGTSTYDGLGLAWAISEHISIKIKAFCLFATHFHELTTLCQSQKAVRNIHVTACHENGQLTMLYKILEGPCDQSFGIHVASIVSFPAEVIEIAKRKAAELEDFEKRQAGGDSSNATDANKRPRLEESTQIVRNVLAEFAAIPIDSLGSRELLGVLDQFRHKIESIDDPFVRSVLDVSPAR